MELMFFFTFFGGFLKQGFKEIEVYFVLEGLNAIEGHVVFNDNGFILNRASFIRKLFWNKVYFIIKERNLQREMQFKTGKKNNVLMNIANFRCQIWLLERRMLLRYWLRCFQIGYVTFSK